MAAILTYKAIGNQLNCIFINNGLLRKGEVEEVQNIFKENFKTDLIYIDASNRFLDKLEGVSDPEAKRKIIGEEFIKVFEENAEKIGKVNIYYKALSILM